MAIFDNNNLKSEESFGGFEQSNTQDESFILEGMDSYPGNMPNFEQFVEELSVSLNNNDITANTLPIEPENEPSLNENKSVWDDFPIDNEPINQEIPNPIIEEPVDNNIINEINELIESNTLTNKDNVENIFEDILAETPTIEQIDSKSNELPDDMDTNDIPNDLDLSSDYKLTQSGDAEADALGLVDDDLRKILVEELAKSKERVAEREKKSLKDKTVEETPQTKEFKPIDLDAGIKEFGLDFIDIEHPSQIDIQLTDDSETRDKTQDEIQSEDKQDTEIPKKKEKKQKTPKEKKEKPIKSEEEKKKKKISPLIYIPAAVLLLAAIGLGSYFMFFKHKPIIPQKNAKNLAVASTVKKKQEPTPKKSDIDSSKVNINKDTLAHEAKEIQKPVQQTTTEKPKEVQKPIQKTIVEKPVVVEKVKETPKIEKPVVEKHKEVKKIEKPDIAEKPKKEISKPITENIKTKHKEKQILPAPATKIRKEKVQIDNKNKDLSLKANKEIYTVQVYATPSKEDAEAWLSILQQKKINDGYISTQKIREKIWYRVRFGSFSDRELAKTTAMRYGFAQTWIDRIK